MKLVNVGRRTTVTGVDGVGESQVRHLWLNVDYIVSVEEVVVFALIRTQDGIHVYTGKTYEQVPTLLMA